VPTGITPKKRVWDVQQTWERTEPRDVLIAAQRNRIGQDLPMTMLETEPEVEVSLPTVSSTNSLDEKAREVNGNGLSASQMGRKKMGTAPVVMAKKGFGFAGVVEERPVLTVLGEGGVNVPRRVRK
jgi:hypothetical protein